MTTTMASNITSSALEDIEQRVVALEIGKQYDATKDAVRKVEEEYLLKLREIKAALTSTTTTSANNNGSTTTTITSTKELEELQKENTLLKQRNAKLEYRVQHLVSNMELLYTTTSKKDNQQQNTVNEF